MVHEYVEGNAMCGQFHMYISRILYMRVTTCVYVTTTGY